MKTLESMRVLAQWRAELAALCDVEPGVRMAFEATRFSATTESALAALNQCGPDVPAENAEFFRAAYRKLAARAAAGDSARSVSSRP